MRNLAQILVVCTVAQALQVIRPGAQWTLQGDTYPGLTWLDTVQVKPLQSEVDQAITTCQNNQILLQAYQVELTTTVAAVAAAAPNYVAASVTSQIQVNKNMARIFMLKQILGLQ